MYIYVENPGENNNIQPNLATAFSGANDGDTIVLPSGTFLFGTGTENTGTYTSEQISTTKFISLKGAGKDSTIIYRPENPADLDLNGIYMIQWNINRDNSSNIIISDFTLKSKIPAGIYNIDYSTATDYGIVIRGAVDFIITNCRFQYFGYTAVAIYHKDNLARGLIYHNEFIHNVKYCGEGLGYGIWIGVSTATWVSSPQFGTNNFIFIEDNFFNYHRHSICGAGSGLYVCRHNIFKNNLWLGAAIDMHEARGSSGPNTYSTRATEIYKNIIVNEYFFDREPVSDTQPYHVGVIPSGPWAGIYSSGSTLGQSAIGIRGGESIIYGNKISYHRYGVCLYTMYNVNTGKPPHDNPDDSSVYPLTSQIGYNSALVYGTGHTGTDSLHGDGDVFIWNNSFQPYGPSGDPYNTSFFKSSHTGVSFLEEGRDYHNVPKPDYIPYQYPHPSRLFDVSSIIVSHLYTGQTDELIFDSLPITVTEKKFLISFIVACDINLTPVVSEGWNLLHQTENIQGTGTTFIYWYKPTETITNPTYSISGLSDQLNAGYIIMLSGCTKNIHKIINYEQSDSYDYGVSGGTIQSTRPHSTAIRMIGSFSGQTITTWDSTPSIDWKELSSNIASKDDRIISLGISYSDVDTTTYNLNITTSTIIPANNVHNLSITRKSINSNLTVI